jgi:PAS domain S-box-containing protein
MKTILVIEDSEQNLYLTRFILEQHGYQVIAATDGPTGIDSARAHRPHLILLDIQLPGMDGHEVARRLRSHPELDATPIVAVTSYAMTGDRESILAAGCTGYIEKPINPDTFVSEIESVLAEFTGLPRDFRVLVVDDLEPNRELLKAVFEAHGWRVAWAGNGTEALELARRAPPELVISDILMPGMDGFSLCREWRRDPALQPIPFVFYTATYTDAQDESFGLSLGADAYLTKPLEPQVLMERLHGILGTPPGVRTPSQSPPPDEQTTLREYNAALVRKLEDKMLQVEALNRELEQRVTLRTRELETANLELQAFGSIGTWTSESAEPGRLTWSAETCRIFGIDPSRFDGRRDTFFRLVHPDDLETVTLASREVWSGRRRLNIQHRIIRPDGQLRWVHQEGSLTTEQPDKPRRVVGIVRDITDYRRLEEQLRQSQKMEAIGQLAGGVAHDFNNLLTIIQGHTSLLAALPGLPEKARESTRDIATTIERAARLTRQLLTFSRRQTAQLHAQNLNGIVSEMTRMLRSLVGARLNLVEKLTPNLPDVLADTTMLEQVIMNLVVNARDAMPDGGDLTLQTFGTHLDPAAAARIGCRSDGLHVCLAVTDTGCGIDGRHLPHLFEPFFTTKAHGKGTGLGLAVVYGIVRQHGGHITVTSKPGTGTTFTVYLPAHDSHAR